MFALFAATIAARRRGFPSASPPPSRAAVVSSRMTFVKSLPRLASSLPFLCLIVLHLLWPDIRDPRWTPRSALGIVHRNNNAAPSQRPLQTIDLPWMHPDNEFEACWHYGKSMTQAILLLDYEPRTAVRVTEA